MNAPTLNIAPDAASLLATIAKLDTLAQAELLSRAWEQMLADATDGEHDALAHVATDGVVLVGFGVSTTDALDHAWANLRDYRSAGL